MESQASSARFQTIAEDERDESNSTSVQLEPYETGSYQAARRIQFSEEDSSSQPTPLEKPASEGNMEVKQGLPVGYWSSDVLSKVTSATGKPLYTDSFTATMAIISYTRVLVETNVEGKQAEEKEKEPQFQGVKKKKCRYKIQEAPQPRYDWKATGNIVQTRPVASKPDKEEGKGVNSDPASSGQGSWISWGHSQPSMIISTWNIRGLNQPLKKKELRHFLKKNKVDVIGVVETRVKVHKAGNILQKMVTDWKHCLNYPMAYNGRVWLLWKDHIQVHTLVVHEQLIHCKISDTTSPFSVYFIVVYPKNESQQREDLWRDWGLGSPVMPKETQALQDWIDTLQLTTLKQRGWHFTFCNKHHNVDQVYSKIDWVLGNFQWIMDYGHIEAEFLNPGVSNHSPILIQEPARVEEEFISFFSSLMGTATEDLPSPNVEVIWKGPCLSYQQRCLLIVPFIDKEIIEAMEGMAKDKTPGIDGFPVEFFMQHWSTVKDDFINVAKEFFSTRKLLKVVSGTSITLVPKIATPTQVKDYRPIACCSTVYKIITKVLTNRIRPVIGKIVSPSQFVSI
ncbi:hypothetical protein KY290_010725 [Solanum tuberosum]|uniref:Endonuclease/exonuclease/phosphatase domain-containing protein n=1 Tax=Solanum tuberosum TaxID=4113 RepID=A0ABQ7VYK5_SOLTU|nr:hypothetical protein KY290_010725 [Solanum tuberosum]